MKYLLLFITYFFLTLTIYAQSTNELRSNSRVKKNFEVLPDKGYSIDRVATDTSLHFNVIDTLYFNQNISHYWIKFKLHNPSNFDENYILYVDPDVESTTFQFDSIQQKWLSQRFGYLVTGRYFYNSPSAVITIRHNETQVNYTLFNFTEYKKYLKKFKPEVLIISEKIQADKQIIPFYAWLISIVTLLLFFLYNAYLYFSLKDKTYLYFLLLQIGAAIYITSSTRLFDYLIETPFLSLSIFSSTELRYFGKNALAENIGSTLVIISFVQVTRQYLLTHIKTPKIDNRLKFLLAFYVLFEAVGTTCLLAHQTLPFYYIDFGNIVLLLVLGYIYYITWYCYRRSYKPAYYLLVANLIPLSIIVILVCSLLFFKSFIGFIKILPDLAAVSQAITFAIALHLRLKNLKHSLNQHQVEAQTLKEQIENLVKRQEAIAKENETIAEEIEQEKCKNEALLQKLEANQRELASNTMFMFQKNSLLSYLKGQMKELNKMLPDSSIQASKNIDASLQNHQFLEADWDKFKLHFENVHPRFFEDLKNKYPDLTKNETRLCAYLHLNMSTKEIAALLNIDPGSVRRAKTRLNKKMNIQVLDMD